MSKSQREKGCAFERLVCKLAREAGLAAERTAPLQAGCTGYGDVLIEGRKVECKHRDYIPQWSFIQTCTPFVPGSDLTRWLADGPAIVRKTGGKVYVVRPCLGRRCVAIPLAQWFQQLAEGRP